MDKLYLFESNDREIKALSDIQKSITGDLKSYRKNKIEELNEQLLNP